MNVIPALPILVPLLGALVALVGRRSLVWQKTVGILTSLLMVGVSALLVVKVADGTAPLVLHTGGWAAPYGITLVVDMLAAALLLLSAVLAATVAVYACGDLDDDRFRFGFVPLTLIMMMGVNGAFVAGDVFNLYVWFEVLLSASFVLLALGGERKQMEGSVKYVALNLISSALFLAGIGILYGMAGTLNMAQLAQVVSEGGSGGSATLSATLSWQGLVLKRAFSPSISGCQRAIQPLRLRFPLSFQDCSRGWGLCVDTDFHAHLCGRCCLYAWAPLGVGCVNDGYGCFWCKHNLRFVPSSLFISSARLAI